MTVYPLHSVVYPPTWRPYFLSKKSLVVARVSARHMEAKPAPRLGEGVRIVRQHNKRPTTRAGRAELKGKKRAFWGAMVMLPETATEPPPTPEIYYAERNGTEWTDMTANALDPPDLYIRPPTLATARAVALRDTAMGRGAPHSGRSANTAPGSADQAALALAMLSGQSFSEPAPGPSARAPMTSGRPAGTLPARGAPPVWQRPMAPHGPGMPPHQPGGGTMPQPQGQPLASRPHGLPLAPPRSPSGAVMMRPPLGKACVVIVSPKTHWQGIPIEEIS